eukprot:763504-Hanusia_phi.AAC.2
MLSRIRCSAPASLLLLSSRPPLLMPVPVFCEDTPFQNLNQSHCGSTAEFNRRRGRAGPRRRLPSASGDHPGSPGPPATYGTAGVPAAVRPAGKVPWLRYGPGPPPRPRGPGGPGRYRTAGRVVTVGP